MASMKALPIFDHIERPAGRDSPLFGAGRDLRHPGHIPPTTPACAAYTHDYLAYLRGKIGEVIDAGKGLEDRPLRRPVPHAHLHTYDLAPVARNAPGARGDGVRVRGYSAMNSAIRSAVSSRKQEEAGWRLDRSADPVAVGDAAACSGWGLRESWKPTDPAMTMTASAG